jgi:hypothetical protein
MEKVDIKQVRSNPDNPRVIKDYKFKKLVKSIKEFPQMLELRPIVVNKEMIVLGGNMRLRACEAAGLKEVPVIFADNLTPEQEIEFVVKDNSSFGEWDWDVLANQWNTDNLKDWGLDIPKWEDTEDFDSDVVDTGDYDFPEEAVEGSHVKMVQLFLNTQTEPLFKEWELELRKIFGTDNLTDTVYEAVKKLYKDNQDDKEN